MPCGSWSCLQELPETAFVLMFSKHHPYSDKHIKTKPFLDGCHLGSLQSNARPCAMRACYMRGAMCPPKRHTRLAAWLEVLRLYTPRERCRAYPTVAALSSATAAALCLPPMASLSPIPVPRWAATHTPSALSGLRRHTTGISAEYLCQLA
jgi:hypothetical protein